MSDNIKEILNPRDIGILDAQIENNWVPKDPREILLPYAGKEPDDVEKKDIDIRREKAKQVYDGYAKVSDRCDNILADISETCKDVVITLKPASQKNTMDAVKRVFGTDGKQITFDMYKEAITKLAELSKSSVPVL